MTRCPRARHRARRRAPGILRAMRLSTSCSSPRSATTPPTRRCRPTACCCGRGTCASSAPGIYSLLPLGFRVNKRVEQVIREEMNAIGGQEMEMPVVHPADLWRESGRYDTIGPEMARFKDRGDRDMVLAMTHEEVVAVLLRDIVQSYRQLPVQRLPLPDEVPRRAALPRRPDPGPRVRDEGRLQLRPRRRRPRRELPEAVRRLRADLRAARARRDRRQLRRRDHGRQPGPTSSWSSTTTARTPSSCATPAATPRTSRSPRSRSPAGGRGRPARSRRSRPPTRRRSRRSPRSSGSRRRGPRRPRSS